MKFTVLVLFSAFLASSVQAKKVVFSHPHGFYEAPFYLTLSDTANQMPEGSQIRYTLDGSEPNAQSPLYTEPLHITGNTLLRTAIVQGDSLLNSVATATYLFLDDVLKQSDTPEGYPSEWGKFCQIKGTAPADYGMDPEMTGDSQLAPKIREGFKTLPILSIVTDKDNLFSHVNDSVKGGIYIFTGPPVGDDTGHGWTRPASVELFGMGHDLSANCGLRLHGGHGRLAEKNPKHSFRLVFKKEYGKKTLEYPLYGEGEPDKFNQLVLRCHFGNAWQHWSVSNHEKAQYTRDVWARRKQREMGWTSVNALYVHLFLNGMYWGMYNIAERVDDQFGKDHLGGKKDSIDVVKIEESGGNHHEAAEGDLEAWNEMISLTTHASIDSCYYRLQGLTAEGEADTLRGALLDIDAFIDYMLINQYGGNNDWDHHNWYAIRRRGPESEGYRFLCWDSELVLEGVDDNVLNKNNGNQFPTGIFQNLLQNEKFARRYLRRAKEVLSADGALGQQGAEATWDSLYNVIHLALYDEAARWGDYRRDVHPYQSRGSLYTVDETYMKERNRLHTQYFPYRSDKVLAKISSYVSVDDFEMPSDWIALNRQMFHKWNGDLADAEPFDENVNVDWSMNQNATNGATIVGFVGVMNTHYADLSGYESLVVRGKGGGIRILCNRIGDGGDWKEFNGQLSENDPYWDSDINGLVLPLDIFRTMSTAKGNPNRLDSFVHLNAIKAGWGQTINVSGIYLIQSPDGINTLSLDPSHDNLFRNLSGQIVVNPQHGIFVRNGHKVILR